MAMACHRLAVAVAVLCIRAAAHQKLACRPPHDRARAEALLAAHKMRYLKGCLLDCGPCPESLYHDLNHAHRVRRQYPSVEMKLAAVSNASNAVVFWGDSIYGMFKTVCDGYESCANGGVGEDTWRSSLARLWTLCSVRPMYAVILLGVNDLQHERPDADTVALARFAIPFIEACSGASVVLQSLLPSHKVRTRTLSTALRGLAWDLKVPFCDVDFKPAPGNLKEDGLHVTPAGYKSFKVSLDACVDRVVSGLPLEAPPADGRRPPPPPPTRRGERRRRPPNGYLAGAVAAHFRKPGD